MKKVLRTFVNRARELAHVCFGDETVSCTPSHSFYAVGRGWVEAKALAAGDGLVTQSGEVALVESVRQEVLDEPVAVYNFEVEGWHTYYVGDSAVLVHNDCDRIQRKQIEMLRAGDDVQVKTYAEARSLLDNMPELRASSNEWLLPNPYAKMADGFADPPGTYRGDLINIHDPLSPVHPDIMNKLHSNNPHYNIRFPNRTKAAIIITGE